MMKPLHSNKCFFTIMSPSPAAAAAPPPPPPSSLPAATFASPRPAGSGGSSCWLLALFFGAPPSILLLDYLLQYVRWSRAEHFFRAPGVLQCVQTLQRMLRWTFVNPNSANVSCFTAPPHLPLSSPQAYRQIVVSTIGEPSKVWSPSWTELSKNRSPT